MYGYQNLSVKYYDVSKPVGTSLSGDLEFYQSHLQNRDKILEAGVGTGRLLVPFLQAGMMIEGVDSSQEMVDLCLLKCEEHNLKAKIFKGDVVEDNFDSIYDAIIVPTGTFCLFNSIETVLANFYKHLKEEGMILFDLIFPTHFKEGQTFVYPLEIEDDSKIILTDTHLSLNWNEQMTHELLRYDLWEQGRLVKSELQPFDIHWYGVQEMCRMLEQAGFSNIELFGDYGESYQADLNYETISIKAIR